MYSSSTHTTYIEHIMFLRGLTLVNDISSKLEWIRLLSTFVTLIHLHHLS